MGAALAAAGGVSSPAAHATVVVLNTCSVTEQAERTARAYLRRVKRQNPAARIVVTGCYAQRAPEELALLEGVDAVIGNSHKALVPQIALAAINQSRSHAQPALVPLEAVRSASGVPVLADAGFAHADLSLGPLIGSSDTRPNLKVQDGCDNRCSFCIIPTTRGSSRSQSLSAVLTRVRAFVDSGGKELVLSGINLGRWGRDLTPPARLEQLVEAILRETDLPRLRLSSVEPMDWSDELLVLYSLYAHATAAPTGPRLARHAHLPLQSGADATLRAMHRRYRPWHYAQKVAAIHRLMPEAAIGADVMVGFPGESDAVFEESYRLIAGLPLTYLHLFPFSARPGTAGWSLYQQQPVPAAAVKERMARLQSLMEERQTARRRTLSGSRLAVVTLKASAEQHARGVIPALSDTFLPVEIRGSEASNQMHWVCVQNAEKAGSVLAATLIPA